ncbi:CpsB/CapC family capsule biosynthesis tyrosine phosphatase [uncultured Porphyromonas sp.]|uniref:tyrosine-protein phosphatase n=1 Tax=uncultured Porphyromonas sp. TaxID=159274 RepID=UPI00261538A1|nr:CpsB/CapC family capsule biosynthesis tyrosine phosphatase [uncultured Porphyromonas sp.]
MWWFAKHKKVDIVAAGWLEGMTDIHCHLIPAVDDGSRSLDETRQLLETMRSVGIRRVVTTPHIYRRYPNNDSNTLQQELERLLPNLADLDIPLMLGAEHMLDEGFEAHLAKPLLTLGNSNYLLVETSFVGAPLDLYRLIQGVISAGAIPMLAHPERYLYMNDAEYSRLRAAGCAFQLNLFSLTGMYGEQVAQRARQLLERGLYSFVGTDTHRIERFRKTISSAKTYARYEEPIRALMSRNDSLFT